MSIDLMRRKLTAILAADAVAYSRLVGENEDMALQVLAGHRAVIDPIITAHSGRLVSTAGDSFLAEFASSIDAVRCAMDIQGALETRNETLPPEARMLFRIGINLGDVVIHGDDILGDGVNVAARLESISDPGGICISSSVYDQINGKINLGFVDIGDQYLKNINRPIRAYRLGGVNPPVLPFFPMPPSSGRHLRKIGALSAGLVAVFLLVMVGRWSVQIHGATDSPSSQPGKSPSIASAPHAGVVQARCAPFRDNGEVSFPLDLRRDGLRIIIERDFPDDRGQLRLHGVPDDVGHLILTGEYFVPRLQRRLPAHFEGDIRNGEVTLTGRMGPRNCTLSSRVS